MIYKTIDEWIEHNPNHIGALPIEVCHQIWGTKGNGISMTQPEQEPVAGEWIVLSESVGKLKELGWNDDAIHKANTPQRTWVGLMRGVRVEGDTLVITVKGGKDAARELCGALIEEMNK